MTTEEIEGLVVGVVGSKVPVWVSNYGDNWGGGGFYWSPNKEMLIISPSTFGTIQGFYVVVHEAIHAARKRMGIEFYNRAAWAHHWTTVCEEEEIVHRGTLEWLKHNVAYLGGTWESWGPIFEEYFEVFLGTYDPNNPPMDYYLGLKNFGLTLENVETGEIDPKVYEGFDKWLDKEMGVQKKPYLSTILERLFSI